MKRFLLFNRDDHAPVAEGVELATGQAVVSWLSATPSVVIWPGMSDFKTVSVDGDDHDGKLRRHIEWLDA